MPKSTRRDRSSSRSSSSTSESGSSSSSGEDTDSEEQADRDEDRGDEDEDGYEPRGSFGVVDLIPSPASSLGKLSQESAGQENKAWSLAKLKANGAEWPEGVVDGIYVALMEPDDSTGELKPDCGVIGHNMGPIKSIVRSKRGPMLEIRFWMKRKERKDGKDKRQRIVAQRRLDKFVEPDPNDAFASEVAAAITAAGGKATRAARKIHALLGGLISDTKTPAKTGAEQTPKLRSPTGKSKDNNDTPPAPAKARQRLFDGVSKAPATDDELVRQDSSFSQAEESFSQAEESIEPVALPAEFAPDEKKKTGIYHGIKLEQLCSPPEKWLLRKLKPEGVQRQRTWYLQQNGRPSQLIWPVALDFDELHALIANEALLQELQVSDEVKDELRRLASNDARLNPISREELVLPISPAAMKLLKFFTLGANHNAAALREIWDKHLLPPTSDCFNKIHGMVSAKRISEQRLIWDRLRVVEVWRNLTDMEALTIALNDNATLKVESTWFETVSNIRRLMRCHLKLDDNVEIPERADSLSPLIKSTHPHLCDKKSNSSLYRYLRVARLPNDVFAKLQVLAEQSADLAYMKSPFLLRNALFLSLDGYDDYVKQALEKAANNPKARCDLSTACRNIIIAIRKAEIHRELCLVAPDYCQSKTQAAVIKLFNVTEKEIESFCSTAQALNQHEKIVKFAAKKCLVYEASRGGSRGQQVFKLPSLEIKGRQISSEVLEAEPAAKGVRQILADTHSRLAAEFAANPTLPDRLKELDVALEEKKISDQEKASKTSKRRHNKEEKEEKEKSEDEKDRKKRRK